MNGTDCEHLSQEIKPRKKKKEGSVPCSYTACYFLIADCRHVRETTQKTHMSEKAKKAHMSIGKGNTHRLNVDEGIS